MISKCGEGAGLLKRIQDEGNSVSLCILDSDYSSVYDGILEKSIRPKTDDSIIIFDSSGNGARADKLRYSGFRVFGSSRFADRLEHDREFGLSFMKQHGIDIPETKCFTDFNQGINFVKDNSDKRFVFKPSGSDLPTKLTYSCSDSEDLILYMKYIEEHFGSEIEDFVLQEFIEGVAVSTEVWVGKYEFTGRFNHTVEVKKLMNDDLGPSTGCSGNLVWLGDDSSPLTELLLSCERSLIKEGYIGPIDLNVIINEDGIYGLEWTPRFGLDAMPTWLQLVKSDIGQMISDTCDGVNKQFDLLDAYSGGVRVTIPPYPIEPKSLKHVKKDSPNKGIPIRTFDEDHCYFYEVERKDDLLVHSDGTGVIAVVSSCDSNDASKPFDIVYDMIDNMKIPDKQYRTDLGHVLPEMYEEVMEVLSDVWS